MAAGAGAGKDREPSEGSFGMLFILFSNREAALFRHCARVDGLLITKSTLKSQGGEAGRKMTPPSRAQAAAGGQQHPPGWWQRVKQKRIETSFTAKKNPPAPEAEPPAPSHFVSEAPGRCSDPRFSPHSTLYSAQAPFLLPPGLPPPQVLPLLAPVPVTRRGEQPFPPLAAQPVFACLSFPISE